MTGVDDLTAFLRARLDEEEQTARECSPWPWDQIGNRVIDASPPSTELGIGMAVGYSVARGPHAPDMAHIAHHDPARVLAEVDAKRRIIDEHAIVHRNIGWIADGEEEYGEIPVCGRCVPKHSHYSRRADVPEWCCRTLRLLALPYADHPSFKEEWRRP